MEKNLNWQKILWSTVLIFGLTLVAYIKYQRSDNEIGFDIYPYVIWPYVIGATTIILILRFSKILKRNSFPYIFFGLLNTLEGLIGLYLNLTSQIKLSFLIYGMFITNILFVVVIFWDVFKKVD